MGVEVFSPTDVRPEFGESPAPLATFYMVRNEKGEYYRTYAQSRCSGWVKDLKDGRLWTSLGPAKGKITNLANSYPKLPVPELVEFVVTEVRVVDQTERVAQAKVKKAEEEAKRNAWIKQERLKDAQAEFDRAQAKLNKLKGTPTERVHGPDCGCKSCVGM